MTTTQDIRDLFAYRGPYNHQKVHQNRASGAVFLEQSPFAQRTLLIFLTMYAIQYLILHSDTKNHAQKGVLLFGCQTANCKGTILCPLLLLQIDFAMDSLLYHCNATFPITFPFNSILMLTGCTLLQQQLQDMPQETPYFKVIRFPKG